MIRKKPELIGGRRFQREGPATEKDLDLAIVVKINIVISMTIAYPVNSIFSD